jgi:hypothetical protein
MSGTDYTQTPKLHLFKPTFNADVSNWGQHWNQNADTLDNVLPLSGGTLTGPLTLNADPTTAMGAATKQYVDASGGGGMASGGVTKTDRSGQIALGNSAQSLMAANTSRHGWSIQNKSSADMWFCDLGVAADPTLANSTYLPPGAYYESEIGGASVQAVSLYGTITNALFVAKEW